MLLLLIEHSDWAEWQLEVRQPGRFDVTASVASLGNADLEITVGPRTLRVRFPKTGDYAKFQTISAGRLELARPGKIKLQVKPVQEGWQPVNLKFIKLVPAR